VNYQAGVKTPVANVVMSLMVMVVLVALTGLFHDTPNAILSSIIINAVISLVDFSAMYKIWKLDFGDFICMLGALLGVVFKSVEIGLLVAVGANSYSISFRISEFASIAITIAIDITIAAITIILAVIRSFSSEDEDVMG
jgi:high affinity sulfate transporter 1